MRCEDNSAQLADYLAGSLGEAEREALESHLACCPGCREELERTAQMWRLLGDIPADQPDSRAMRARFDAMLAEGAPSASAAPAAGGAQAGAVVTDAAGARSAPADARVTDAAGAGNALADARVSDAAGARPRPRGRVSSWMRRHARGVHVPVQPLLQGCAALLLVLVGIQVGRGIKPAPTSSPEVHELSQEVRDLRQMVTLSLLQQQSASERLKGISWSSQLDRPGDEVVAALIDTLMHDANVNVRLASIDALKRFAERDVVQRAAIHALDTQKSPLVQMALIDFVVETQDRAALEALRKLSSDNTVDKTVRARAMWGIDHLEARA